MLHGKCRWDPPNFGGGFDKRLSLNLPDIKHTPLPIGKLRSSKAEPDVKLGTTSCAFLLNTYLSYFSEQP